MIAASDDDWTAVVGNLSKAQRPWAWVLRILGREGAYPQTSRNFYMVVVHAKFLFGSETWLIIPIIWRTLHRFHHKVARQMAKMHPRRAMMGRCIYPLLDEVITAVEL